MRKRSKRLKSPTLVVQESLQMGVTMTEVKDYLEYWLSRKTSDMQKEHGEQVASMKVRLPVLYMTTGDQHTHQAASNAKHVAMQGELETLQLEIGSLTGRLGETEDLRDQLEKAQELIQDMNTELGMVREETQRLKSTREEIDMELAEKDKEVVAVKGANAKLVAEVQERHDFAEKIRENWGMIKATVETFQCGEVKPCMFPLLLFAYVMQLLQSL